MAARSSVPDVQPLVRGCRRPGVARTRLIVALMVSACLHLWLGAGTTFNTPGSTFPRAMPPLTARLDLGGVRPEPQAQPEDDLSAPEPADEHEPAGVPAPAPPRANPVYDRVAPESGVGHSTGKGEAEAAPGVGPIPPHAGDPTYYPASELDVFPAPITPLKFEVPQQATRDNVRGKALVMLLLDESGAVRDIAVVSSEPPGYFEEAAIAGFAEARFTPARKDDRPVRSRVLIAVDFNR
jgi:TonB family protein